MSWNKTPTHWSWVTMRQRCGNPNTPKYRLYGGRGIAVCERWQDFDNFLADMGPRPEGMTLDRVDSDGNYEPGNCRWATFSEQNRHKRTGKLTERDVAWIRANAGVRTQTSMAQKFGVTQGHISGVIAGVKWSPCHGNNSETSSETPSSEPEQSEPPTLSPAPTTASRSKRGRTGSRSARGTAGGQAADTSAADEGVAE